MKIVKKQKTIRPFGKILLDLEVILDELIDDHDVQIGDVLAIVYQHLNLHRPDAQEEFEDGTHPKFTYK